MRLIPRSLYGRLLALSAIATACALAIAAVAIGAVLEHVVMEGLDQRLDTQVAILAKAVKPDGRIDRAALVSPAPYDRAGSGWGWRIDAPADHAASPDAPTRAADALPLPPHPPPGPDAALPHPPLPPDDAGEPRPLDWRGPDGGPRHARRLTIATAAGPVTITASAPRALVARPLRAAMAPLLGALLLLGIALAAASLVQLRLGLRPLGRLRGAIAAVRGGAARHVPEDQPAELQPLAAELNALIDQNAAQLAAARGHVANLAHGLKTPLAALQLRLGAGNDPDGALAAEAARIERAIRHHLARARADASGSTRHATPLAPALAGLAEALGRIHADRGIAFAADAPADLAAAIDPQDLDELLGNVLDNAWRFAREAIRVTAARDEGRARIVIADDGPGIAAADRAAALAPGRRLDESGEGHGFGLAIARELAELHGGTLGLAESPRGGLAVMIALPLATPV